MEDQDKILLVDDDPVILKILTESLTRNGFTIESAEDGESGLEKTKEFNPDLIITDVVMPGISGIEMISELRGLGLLTAPVIFMSGKTESTDMRAGLAAGGDDYIHKPFSVEEVLSSIELRLAKTKEFKNEYKQLKIDVEELSKTNAHLMTATFRERDLRKKLQDTLDELDRKNKDILASIQYAKRIQEAMMPSEELLKKTFKDHFVLYLPKDIVSGDFYWMELINGKIYWAVVDCTGHGVPGAFVSILGNNGLKRAVHETGAETPGAILNSLSKHIINSITSTKSGEVVQDGMDIALCCYDPENYTLQFAGAYNPMVLIRNKELTVVKGTKRPIGRFKQKGATDFETKEILLEDNDRIYIFSDGFADQFNETGDEKFSSRRLRELLLENHSRPFAEQYGVLLQEHVAWKGVAGQIDDICVFGIRI